MNLRGASSSGLRSGFVRVFARERGRPARFKKALLELRSRRDACAPGSSNSALTFVLILSVICALSLSACSVQRAGPLKDTLRVNIGSEPPSLDWHVCTDNTSFDVLSNMMVGLTQFRNDLSCVPGCAKSWDILDGGKKYVFHLRDDAKWSDGKPVVAGDFEYAWKRLLDPQTAAPYAFFLYDVENAFDFNTGKIKDASKIGISCPDDHTLEVRLRKPVSYFTNLAALVSTYPLRKDIVEKYGNRWTEPENIIVNGPFVPKDWKHEYKIELVANPLFFEGEPKVKRIQMFMVPEQATAFALYENGQLDYLDNRSFPTPEVAHYSSSPEYVNVPLLKSNYVGFNVHKKPFDDKRVRLAISMSLDRDAFPKILRRREHPAFSFIPDGMSSYTPVDPPKYDPVAARKLLADAGYPDGKGFPSIQILYPSREDSRLVMEAIQDQLKRNLNLQFELTNQEFKVYMNTLHRDPPPIFVANWGADFPDPETFASVFVSHNSNNHTLWTDPVYDKLVSQAEAELDPVKRIKLYQQADHLLCAEEAAVAVTYNATQNTMVKPWIKGVKANRIDVMYLKDAEIDKQWTENKSSNGAL